MTAHQREGAPVAVVGVADTDYLALKGRKGYSAAELARDVLEAAVLDSGLSARDIECVGVTSYPRDSLRDTNLMTSLGIHPREVLEEGTLTAAAAAIRDGRADTVALVYATAQRSIGVQYGGSQGTRYYESYYYYHPWGFSSQGAHWALMFRRHQLTYGSTEEQLGAVAEAVSLHASLNPKAVRQSPLSLADYIASPYICRPLRRADYCGVNDGAVALILRRADKASGLPHTPVAIAAHSEATQKVDVAQLRPLVMEGQYDAIRSVTKDALDRAGGLGIGDIDHFQAYDASTVNLPLALEGAGFCERGLGFDYIQDGRIGLSGELPCNTSGGMLFEAYMQGWNHAVEAVRQLRHEAGNRQVDDARFSMYVMQTSGSVSNMIYARLDD